MPITHFETYNYWIYHRVRGKYNELNIALGRGSCLSPDKTLFAIVGQKRMP